MNILSMENCTIVLRHFVKLLYLILKFVFLLVIGGGLYVSVLMYKGSIGTDLVVYIFFPAIFLLVNYGFVQLILWYVRYYNQLVIILRDKLIIIDSSLILQEDVEIMDLSKVMKIDIEKHGWFANLLGYGHLIMEQQKDDVRVIHFIPKPYKIWQILRERTNYLAQGGQEVRFFKTR